VPKDADAKTIKAAYYKEAKKSHPDLNPNDAQAKERFQKLAAAYELLNDPVRRRTYDFTGQTTDNANQQYQRRQAQQGAQYVYEGDPQQHAEAVFRSVFEDMNVIKDAIQSYGDELRSEAEYAASAARDGRWGEVWDVAWTNKGFVFGVVMPALLLLRYPPLIPWALRIVFSGSQVLLVILLRSGNISTAARLVWQMVVRLALAQKNRQRPSRRKQ
jgi:curved DNA-binding protein CbpA